ncbi:MAG: phosphoribosylanthranilate isomerase [Erythrobacter sp.]|uniref:phosphoribosylanthranilate isomerase n=1 Tax=Erythrobacter sp. TaxID=1042 RepID=UPI003264E981
MKIKIKICGIREESALEAVIDAGADFGGFIFHDKSPRNLTIEEAASLSKRANGRIARVGLIVNPQDAFLDELFAKVELEALQLQGSESPERVQAIRERYGVDVWKAISVATKRDIQSAQAYQQSADLILFDAKTPPGALPGGMGLRFDWTLLDGIEMDLPWGLAGGLSPDNVSKAIQLTRAPMVDVCSGTERAPGIKDVDKITAFCKAALQA